MTFLNFFSVLWSLIAGVYIFAVTFIPIAEPSIRFADSIVSFLMGTIVAGIVGYHFGSSASSRAKDTAIAYLSDGAPGK